MQENGKLDKEFEDKMEKAGRLCSILRSTFLNKREIPKEIKVKVVRKIVTRKFYTYWKNVSTIDTVEMRFLWKIEEKTRRRPHNGMK